MPKSKIPICIQEMVFNCLLKVYTDISKYDNQFNVPVFPLDKIDLYIVNNYLNKRMHLLNRMRMVR